MIISPEDTKARRDKDELSRMVVNCAHRMHVEIAPGLLESVYEAVLEKLAPVHAKQVLTYLRLLNLPLGLLINFGAVTFKEGCRRIVNGKQDFVSSCLHVNNNQGSYL